VIRLGMHAKKAPLRSILHGVRSMSETGFLPESVKLRTIRNSEEYKWHPSANLGCVGLLFRGLGRKIQRG